MRRKKKERKNQQSANERKAENNNEKRNRKRREKFIKNSPKIEETKQNMTLTYIYIFCLQSKAVYFIFHFPFISLLCYTHFFAISLGSCLHNTMYFNLYAYAMRAYISTHQFKQNKQ